MDFLRRLFGGSRASHTGLVLYVKPKMCNRVMPLEVKTSDQLSRTDDEKGYWVRKLANHPRCPFEVEVIMHFDNSKKLIDKEINNGEFVTEAAYLEFLESDKK